MKKKHEKQTLYYLLAFGLLSLFMTCWKKRNLKEIVIVFLTNSYTNVFVASALAAKNYLQYPTRLFPRIYRSSIIYDYLLCSLVSIWFVQATEKDQWKQMLVKVWLFALPQALVERWLEKHTSLIIYRKGWSWIHSLVTIALAKLLNARFIRFLNKYEERISRNHYHDN
ncbi:hypothetical protein LCL95_01375 [Bacillus timonensis]|nr:hypothetical protein [Bacillus timonensis]